MLKIRRSRDRLIFNMGVPIPGKDGLYIETGRRSMSCFLIRARFLPLALSKLRLCSANHRPGYFSNLACDWLSIVWAYSEQDTENGPWALCFPNYRVVKPQKIFWKYKRHKTMCHPFRLWVDQVTSFAQHWQCQPISLPDVPLPLHFESLLKTGDWEHKPAPSRLMKPLPTQPRRPPKRDVRRYNKRLNKSASAALISSSKDWTGHGPVYVAEQGHVHENPSAHQTLLMILQNVRWFVQDHQTYWLIIWKTFH